MDYYSEINLKEIFDRTSIGSTGATSVTTKYGITARTDPVKHVHHVHSYDDDGAVHHHHYVHKQIVNPVPDGISVPLGGVIYASTSPYGKPLYGEPLYGRPFNSIPIVPYVRVNVGMRMSPMYDAYGNRIG